MRLTNLHDLPKVRDRLTYLYVERARIDQEAKAIAIHNAEGLTPVPCAGLACLMLGPGSTITHAAVLTLADNGCLVVWCGEEGVRFYSAGVGTTRNADNLLRQAALSSNQRTRLLVVRRLYNMRFEDKLPADLSLQQIRGREGVRVREAYARMSAETGVPWSGRSYNRGNWRDADPVNRALSAGNSCLYGICHAAIVAAGYSPALGFIHIGKQLSFVYDVADLYKADMTVPAAFRAAATVTQHLEREVRRACRDIFAKERLLERIVRDMDYALQVPIPMDSYAPGDFDEDAALPGGLWDPEQGAVSGGTNYSEGIEDVPDEEDPP
jgi:CRISP-associated protein Cas1